MIRHRKIYVGGLVALLGGMAALLTGSTPPSGASRVVLGVIRTEPAEGHTRTQPWPPTERRGWQAVGQGGLVLWPAAQIGWGMFFLWPHAHYLSWVMETSNGGRTWNIRPTPRIRWEAMTASPSNVNLLGQPLRQATSTQLVWLRTRDGGHRWTRTTFHTPGKMSVAAIVDQVMPDPPTTVFPRAGFPALGLLTNGGAFWWTQTGHQWHTRWPATDKITAIAPAPHGMEAIAGETAEHQPWMEFLGVGSHERILPSSLLSLPTEIVGMDWLTAHDGWIWSTTGLWRTTNGGKSWIALGTFDQPGLKDAQFFSQHYPVGWVHMATSTEGWAATNPFELGGAWQALWRTTTGGKTWERVPIPHALTHYRAGHVLLPFDGFDIAAQRPSGALTLWMGPDDASFSATPERIWTNDWGKHWHRARTPVQLSGPYD